MTAAQRNGHWAGGTLDVAGPRESVSSVVDTAELLDEFWGMQSARVRPLRGGINSETWLVEHQEATYVAKRVSRAATADLVAGCRVAALLSEAGFVTGRPVPTSDGRLVVTEHALALLEYVPGRELAGETGADQRCMGGTLAGIHLAGGPAPGPGVATFMTEWLAPELPGLQAHPWLVGAVKAVRAETDPLKVTWSMLHTDPSPEAFVHNDSTGVTGLIDWTGARRGPILYDVASAVMYLGGPEHATAFLTTYATEGPLGEAEMQHLDAFRRFREAIQGAYFAGRLAANDLTGGIDQAENEKGLDDARRRLGVLGLDIA